MIGQLANVNWISVLLAFVAYGILGGLWFALLFSKPYKISLGRANETLQNKSLLFMIGPALCSLVITIATAVLMEALQIHSLSGAFEFAAIIGIGYLVANTFMIAINPNIPRPILYGLISGGYHFVGILIVSVIIVAMR